MTHHYIDETSGLPVCDVADGYGNQYFGCRMMDMGGGDVDSFDYSPPPVHNVSNAHNTETYDDTGDVLISFGDGRNPKPVVLGTIYSAKRQESITVEEQDNGDSVDYGDIQNFEDRTIKHKKLRMVFAKTGTWLLDAKATKKPIRFQLDKKAFVRVSQDGAANEFVLLGNVLLNHVKAIHERMDTLARKIDDVEKHVLTVAEGLTKLSTQLSTATVICSAPGNKSTPLMPTGAAIPPALSDILSEETPDEEALSDVISDIVDDASALENASSILESGLPLIMPYTDANAVATVADPENVPFGFAKSSATPDGDKEKLKAGCLRISSTSVFDQEGEEP